MKDLFDRAEAIGSKYQTPVEIAIAGAALASATLDVYETLTKEDYNSSNEENEDGDRDEEVDPEEVDPEEVDPEEACLVIRNLLD